MGGNEYLRKESLKQVTSDSLRPVLSKERKQAEKYREWGKLEKIDVPKGHVVKKTWGIDLPLRGYAFQLINASGRHLARMDNDGKLTVYAGYKWDGSSGPTIDGDADIEASCVHDILYQAMTLRKLPYRCRKEADIIYRELLIKHGKWPVQAWWRYFALRLFAGKYARPKQGPVYPTQVAG